MKIIIYVEMFWIAFASFILGMMALGIALNLSKFTNMDFYIVLALGLRIIISIFWIQDEFKLRGVIASQMEGKD